MSDPVNRLTGLCRSRRDDSIELVPSPAQLLPIENESKSLSICSLRSLQARVDGQTITSGLSRNSQLNRSTQPARHRHHTYIHTALTVRGDDVNLQRCECALTCGNATNFFSTRLWLKNYEACRQAKAQLHMWFESEQVNGLPWRIGSDLGSRHCQAIGSCRLISSEISNTMATNRARCTLHATPSNALSK